MMFMSLESRSSYLRHKFMTDKCEIDFEADDGQRMRFGLGANDGI